MQRIGFLGGTFNPVHFGHLHLANEMIRHHHLDEVWLCPAQMNPFKTEQEPIPVHHRLKMLELAIEGHSKLRVCDVEANRAGPSYTIDTLRTLIDLHKGSKQFFLILGDDCVSRFLEWRTPEEIVSLVPLLVGRREEACDFTPFSTSPKVHRAMEAGLTEIDIKPISSTDVRARLHCGLDCSDKVPAKVLDYIAQHQLYSAPKYET